MNTKSSLLNYTFILALGTGLFLLIPLIAMQFTGEVNWTLSDFIFAGVLIFGTGMAYKLITFRSDRLRFRFGTGLGLATGFMMIWANGAVGFIGSEDNPFNIAYLGLIAVGLLGMLISRFRPRGLAITLYTLGGLQILITIYALIDGQHLTTQSSVAEILLTNGIFIGLWLTAALQFRGISDSSHGEGDTNTE